MWTAQEIQGDRRTLRFRSIPNLVRRLGGTTHQIQHDEAYAPPMRTIMVLRKNRKVGGYDVITRVMVPSEAVERAGS